MNTIIQNQSAVQPVRSDIVGPWELHFRAPELEARNLRARIHCAETIKRELVPHPQIKPATSLILEEFKEGAKKRTAEFVRTPSGKSMFVRLDRIYEGMLAFDGTAPYYCPEERALIRVPVAEIPNPCSYELMSDHTMAFTVAAPMKRKITTLERKDEEYVRKAFRCLYGCPPSRDVMRAMEKSFLREENPGFAIRHNLLAARLFKKLSLHAFDTPPGQEMFELLLKAPFWNAEDYLEVVPLRHLSYETAMCAMKAHLQEEPLSKRLRYCAFVSL